MSNVNVFAAAKKFKIVTVKSVFYVERENGRWGLQGLGFVFSLRGKYDFLIFFFFCPAA